MTNSENMTTTKDKILEAAKNLFAEKGFDNTGIKEIGEKVGIATSVIYYHFKNKEDILNSLIDSYLKEIKDFKREKGEEYFSKPTQQKHKKANREAVNFFNNKQLTKIILMESLKRTDDFPVFKLWEENFNALLELYGNNVKKSVKENQAEYLFKTFLIMALPRLGYQVFAEEWCKQYNMEEKEVNKIFIEVMTEINEKIMKEQIWEV